MENGNDNAPMKKISDEIAAALESCANALSLNEFSRVTGVRVELLRRFLNKKARYARAETWDKIYPTLKPYLLGPEPIKDTPVRIGPPYRRHGELVEMFSDQKVLLDEFAVLSPGEQKKFLADFAASAPDAKASEYSSLTADENQIMGAFLAMDAVARETALKSLTDAAVAEVRRRRSELF